MRWMLRILALMMLCALPAAAQQKPVKFALVIGNADYVVPAWKLANPVRDANLMATRLRALGFEVDLLPNATRAQMEGAIERFSMKLSRGGDQAVSLFYYSGHGAEEGAVNYLIPVDADIRTKEQLRFRAPSAQLVLDEMGQAGNAVNIMILDACRDLPLAEGGKALSRGGLADLRQTPNVFIAYATAPNQTASDGAGANSPFTTALAEALRTQSGDPIELLFSDINARVRAATGNAQQPRYSNGLPIPRWTFSASAPASTPRPNAELERLRRENEAFRSAKASPPPQASEAPRAPGAPGAPGAWGAFALSKSDPKLWGAWLAPGGRAAAESEAIRHCPGNDCSVTNVGPGRCLAIAQSMTNGVWYGVYFGDTLTELLPKAVAACASYSGQRDCAIVHKDCLG